MAPAMAPARAAGGRVPGAFAALVLALLPGAAAVRPKKGSAPTRRAKGSDADAGAAAAGAAAADALGDAAAAAPADVAAGDGRGDGFELALVEVTAPEVQAARPNFPLVGEGCDSVQWWWARYFVHKTEEDRGKVYVVADVAGRAGCDPAVDIFQSDRDSPWVHYITGASKCIPFQPNVGCHPYVIWKYTDCQIPEPDRRLGDQYEGKHPDLPDDQNTPWDAESGLWKPCRDKAVKVGELAYQPRANGTLDRCTCHHRQPFDNSAAHQRQLEDEAAASSWFSSWFSWPFGSSASRGQPARGAADADAGATPGAAGAKTAGAAGAKAAAGLALLALAASALLALAAMAAGALRAARAGAGEALS